MTHHDLWWRCRHVAHEQADGKGDYERGRTELAEHARAAAALDHKWCHVCSVFLLEDNTFSPGKHSIMTSQHVHCVWVRLEIGGKPVCERQRAAGDIEVLLTKPA